MVAYTDASGPRNVQRSLLSPYRHSRRELSKAWPPLLGPDRVRVALPRLRCLPRYPKTVIRDLAKFIKPRVPTKEEKQRAHAQIMSLLEGDLPTWLVIGEDAASEEPRGYSMFSHKLLPETWYELEKNGSSSGGERNGGDDYAATPISA